MGVSEPKDGQLPVKALYDPHQLEVSMSVMFFKGSLLFKFIEVGIAKLFNWTTTYPLPENIAASYTEVQPGPPEP